MHSPVLRRNRLVVGLRSIVECELGRSGLGALSGMASRRRGYLMGYFALSLGLLCSLVGIERPRCRNRENISRMHWVVDQRDLQARLCILCQHFDITNKKHTALF